AAVDLGGVVGPSVDTAATVDLASASVDVAAGPVDAGLGVDLGTGTVAVDLGTTTIETPPVVPTVVEEVVAPLLRGLLGQ
ncbi:MAG: hypothetical protein ACRETT_03115, partial [Steroidobacteraceae bacterium]